jgi:Bacterial PH domain
MRDDDFAFEPVPGLPAELPQGEHLLWQGAPEWRALAWRVFHLREVTSYFLVLIGWSAFSAYWTHGTAKAVFAALGPVSIAGVLACALLALLARASARSTVYSITSERVVMRIGVALPVTFNLPFAVIDGAAARQLPDGSGDVSLTLTAGTRLAYFVLWPHARPWCVRQPEPSFRALPDVAQVARVLARALATKSAGQGVVTELAAHSGLHGGSAGEGLPNAAGMAH